jgi:hypothetical protein
MSPRQKLVKTLNMENYDHLDTLHSEVNILSSGTP